MTHQARIASLFFGIAALIAPGSALATDLFQDVAGSVGLTRTDITYGASWADIDNDGRPDLWSGNHNKAPTLYRNDPTQGFVPYTNIVGLINEDIHGSAFADFDNDGDQDLLITVGAEVGVGVGSNQLLVNNNGVLTEEGAAYDIQYEFGRSRHLTWFDWNNDGHLDFMLVAQNTRPAPPDAPSRVFTFNPTTNEFDEEPWTIHSKNNTTFAQLLLANPSLATSPAISLNQNKNGFPDTVYSYNSTGLTDATALFNFPVMNGIRDVALGDFNNDGTTDLLGVGSGDVFLLTQTASGFTDITTASGLNFDQGLFVVSADFDNDKDLDIYVGRSSPGGDVNHLNKYFRNNGNNTFTEIANGNGAEGNLTGFLSGVTVADYNNDGFVDILATNSDNWYVPSITGPMQLFENQGNGNNWLAVELVGTVSNRDAIGAVVDLTSGATTQTREQNGGIHHRSQNHSRLHFGLATDPVVTSLTVTWPSGTIQTFPNVTPNQILRVYENDPGQSNLPPVAEIEITQSANELMFDFSSYGSFDPDGIVASYSWDFGDGVTSSEQNPAHTYAAAGTYNVILTVTDNMGTTATATQSLDADVTPIIADVGSSPANAPRVIDELGDGSLDLSTHWTSTGNLALAWITLDLGYTQTLNGVEVAPRGDRAYEIDIYVGDTLAGGKVSGGPVASCEPAQTGNMVPSALILCPITPTSGRYLTIQSTNLANFRLYGVRAIQGSAVNQLPLANFTATPQPNGLALTVDGSASSDSDGTVTGYQWNFGDSTTGTGATFTHDYANAGTYDVTLTVTDNESASRSLTAQVVIVEPSSSLLPATISAAGTNSSTQARAGDLDTDGTQLLSTRWLNTNSDMDDAWYTLDLGQSTNIGSLKLAPRATLDWVLDITVGDTLDSNGKVSGATPVRCTIDETSGSGTPTFLSQCPLGTLTGRYISVQSVNRNRLIMHGSEVYGPASTTNQPPMALPAYSQQTGTFTIDFDGSGSTDSDGTITSYLWDFDESSATGTGVLVSHTYPDEQDRLISLVVIDNAGALNALQQPITIDELSSEPQFVTQPQNQTVEEGAAATFTVTVVGDNPINYQWRRDGSDIPGATANSYTLSTTLPADSGSSYDVVATNASGTATSTSATLTVQPSNLPPVASFSQDVTTGEAPLTVNFDGSGSSDIDGSVDQWSWDFGDGGTSSGATPNYTFSSVGSFTVTLVVTDNDGATASTTATITTTAPDQPEIIIQPQSIYVNDGSTATFAVAAIGNPPLSYQWYENGQLLPGAIMNSHSFTAGAADNGSVFTVIVTGPTASVTSDAAILTLNTLPQAAFTATPNSGTTPFTVSFDSSASSDSDGTIESYAWNYGDGNTGSGASTSHEYVASGTFTATLTVTDNNGGQDSTTQQITANQPPTVAMTLTPSTGAAPLTVSADGSASTDPDGTITSWDWDFGDGNSATGPQVSHVFAGGTSSVTLTVTDNSGATASATQVVFANTPPVAMMMIDTLIDLAPLTINVDATGTTDAEDNIATYEWDFGDGNTATGTTASNTYTQVGTYVVTLTVTDTSGATDVVTETVIANAAPVAVFNTSSQLATIPFVLNLDASNSSDANGTITSYSWDFGDGNQGIGATTSHNYTTPGSYTITLTVTDNHGATKSTTQMFTANDPPVAAITFAPAGGVEPLFTTADGTASSDSDGSILSYQWDFGDGNSASGSTVPHTYTEDGSYTATLTVTDNNGASASTQAIVVVDPVVPPAIIEQPQSVTAIVGGSAEFTVIANGTAPLSYQWQKNGVDIGGAANASLTVSGLSLGNDTDEYRVTVSNPGGAIQSAAATLSVIAAPTITVQPQPQTVSDGDDATFSVLASGSGTLTYQWQRNGLAITGADAANYTLSPAVLADDGDLFSVVVSNLAGGTASNSAALQVNSANIAPSASFTSSQNGNTLSFSFDASSSSDSDGSITDYAWDFGDGSTGNGSNTSHEFASEGSYLVVLTVTDNAGATNTSQENLTATLQLLVAATGTHNNSQDPNSIVDTLTGNEQNLVTNWQNNGSAGSAWFTIDLGVSKNLDAVLVAPRANRNYNLSLSVGDNLTNGKVTAAVAGTCSPTQTGSTAPTQLTSCPIIDTLGRYVTVERTNGGVMRMYGFEVSEVTGPGNQAPNATFELAPQSGTGQISLDASGSTDIDGTIVEWLWDFGDGSSASGETTAHTFVADGTYTITLTVTDDAGTTDQTSQIATIDLLGTLLKSPSVVHAVGANTAGSAAINDTLPSGEQNLSTVWDNNSGLNTAWLTLDLGSSQTLVELHLGLKGNLQYDLDIVVGDSLDATGMVTGGTTTLCATTGIGTSTPSALEPCAVPFLTGRYVTIKSTNRSNYRVHGVEAWVEDNGQNNLAPTAMFAFNQQTGTLSVDFDASASTDSDGTIDAYSWDFGDGSSATGDTVTHLYATDGTYTVSLTVTDNNGATNTDTQSVEVTPLPVAPEITTQPQAVNVTEGDAATFTVTATGLPEPSYQWQRNGTDIVGATAASFTLGSTTLADSGQLYQVVVSNSEGNVTSASALLTVDAPNVDPVANFSASPLAGVAPLLVSVDGTTSSDSDGTITAYAWDFGNSSSASGAINSVTYTTPGTFTINLTVTDNEGASHTTSQQVVVSPAPQPPTISNQPQNVSAEVGDNISFSVIAAGANPLSYQWHRDGNPISGATTASYDFNAIQLSDDAATFKVTVSNTVGSVDSNTVTLSVTEPVNQSPTAMIAATLAADGLTFNFDAGSSTDSDGSITDYSWSFGDGNSTNQVSALYSHTYAAAGSYTVTLTVTDNEGATDTATSNVTATGTLVPTRTDTTIAAAGGRISKAPNAIDQLASLEQNLANYWNSGSSGGVSNAWLTLDLGESRDVTEIRVAPRADRSHNLSIHVGNSLTNGQVNNAASGQCTTPDLGSTASPSQLNLCPISESAGRYVTLYSLNQSNVRIYGFEVWALEAGTPPANEPPIAALTTTPVTDTLTANFDASGSTDSDGTIVSYLWAFGDGTTDSTSVPTSSHTYASDGTYSVTVEVVDNDSATATATESVTVAEGGTGGPLALTIAGVGSSSGSAGRAIDVLGGGEQDLSTHWNNGSSGLSNAWITYDLGSTTPVSTLFVAARSNSSYNLDITLGDTLTGGLVAGPATTNCVTDNTGQLVPTTASTCTLPAGSSARYITIRSKNFAQLRIHGTEIH